MCDRLPGAAIREAYMAGVRAACLRMLVKPYRCEDCERGADEYVAALSSTPPAAEPT